MATTTVPVITLHSVPRRITLQLVRADGREIGYIQLKVNTWQVFTDKPGIFTEAPAEFTTKAAALKSLLDLQIAAAA